MKFLPLILVLTFFSCHEITVETQTNSTTTTDSTEENVQEVKNDDPTYSTKTIFSLDNGWGYQIYKDTALFINQPHIPSIQGNKGFKSELKALTTANYILNKLNNDIFPPTISPEELDSLGVL
jgi:hypothetical protein